MGKGLLLMVGAFALAAGTMMFNGVGRGAISAVERLGEHGSRLVAREIAHTGMGDALRALSLEYATAGAYSGATNWAGNYQGGNYDVTLDIAGNTITVVSTGNHEGAQYVVRRIFTADVTAGTPGFMQATLTSDGNLIMDHNISIVSANPSENASVHSNGNIEIKSGSAYIEGFGHYNGNLTITNGQTASSVFVPNANPTGDPITEQVDEIEVPAFSATSYQHLATWSPGGNLVLSGSYSLGTEANPTVWYVNGNVTTSSDVTFSGYGAIIVTGNIEIDHDVVLSGSPTTSTLGLYTNGNIILNQGHLDVAGQWFANGNIRLQDQTHFAGTMTTFGNFEFYGALNATYRPVSQALTELFWPFGGVGLSMSTTREWAVE